MGQKLKTLEVKRAPVGTCEYKVRGEDGLLAECGGAPKWRGRLGPQLTYCDAHGQLVGRSMEVIAVEADADGRRQTIKPWKEYLR